MKRINRRSFLKAATALPLAWPGALACTVPFARVRGANNDIRVGVVGFRGHGKTHINAYREMRGVRVAGLCDVDMNILQRGVGEFRNRNENVSAYVDVRQMLDDKSIDAVSTATPNHWHALVTVWACQAGKDVCVEKPVSHNIWEGRKMVEAARRYNRMVQADLDLRSNDGLRQAVEYVQRGSLGKILVVHGFCYKRRRSMGKVAGPQRIPAWVNYDLWCGPAPMGPLMRENLHYDWHWVWDTGCGELGNNGPHQLDICRWVLNQEELPRRVMSVGGRFGYDDDGQTPNTQIALYEYDNAPIIYEVRGLPAESGSSDMDIFHCKGLNDVTMRAGSPGRGPNTGVVVQCEDGYIDLTGRVACDNESRIIKRFASDTLGPQPNFIKAVRSRRRSDLRTDILEGHLSTCLSHMGNISHRIGRESSPEEIAESLKDVKGAGETIDRFEEHLERNSISLKSNRAVRGPWLQMDSVHERFTGQFGHRANELLSREYRPPFIVPDVV